MSKWLCKPDPLLTLRSLVGSFSYESFHLGRYELPVIDSEHLDILHAEVDSVRLCAALFTFYESFLKLVFRPWLWQRRHHGIRHRDRDPLPVVTYAPPRTIALHFISKGRRRAGES